MPLFIFFAICFPFFIIVFCLFLLCTFIFRVKFVSQIFHEPSVYIYISSKICFTNFSRIILSPFSLPFVFLFSLLFFCLFLLCTSIFRVKFVSQIFHELYYPHFLCHLFSFFHYCFFVCSFCVHLYFE